MYFEFTPKRSKLNAEYDNLSDVKNEPFDIMIPHVVGHLLIAYRDIINDIQKINDITKQAKAYLKKLNKKYSLHLTINKVSNYLKRFLYHSATDVAVAEILTLSEINHLSALPYYSVTRGDIYYAQYHYYVHLNELLLNQPLNPDWRLNTPLKKEDLIFIPDLRYVYKGEEKTGTKLSLDEEKIKEQIVSPMLKKIEQLQNKKHKSTADFIKFHNAFMDYLYILLGLSSGYRPVNETFGRLDDIDINTGMFFISDKENRVHSQGRFIYLPDITRIQLKKYIDYLYLNMRFYKNNHNPLGNLLKLIFESQTATITYLTVNDSGNAETVQHQNLNFIEERLSSFARLPLNWYRHHIRSLKSFEHSIYSPSLSGEESISDEVISSWMGHAD